MALPWLVLSAHAGTVTLGIVLACYGVTRTALIPLGGVLADRIGQRTIMLTADAARCGLVALLAVAGTAHLVSVAVLGPLAALVGAGEGLFIPASYAIMPSLLDDRLLQAGNAVSTAAVQAGSLLGPALGGALVASWGSGSAFAVDAASFAVSAVTLALIRSRRATAECRGRDGTASEAAVPDGGPTAWSLLRGQRVLQIIIAVTIGANLAGGAESEVALPALAHARFGAAGYGAAIACFAAGSLIGILAVARSGRITRPAVTGGMAFLIQALAIGLIPFLGGLPGAAAASLLFPIASVTIAAPVLAGLTRREFRAFGAPSREPQAGTWSQAPGPGPAV